MRLIRGQEETGNLCEQDGLVVGRECELDFSRGAAGETAQDSVATVESTMLAVETIEVITVARSCTSRRGVNYADDIGDIGDFTGHHCHWLGVAPPIQLAGESSHGPFTPRNPSFADARFTIPLSTRTTIPRSCGDPPRCCGTRRSGLSASATRATSSVMRLSHLRTVMLGFSGVFGVCSRRCYPYRPSRADGLQPPLGLGDRSPSQAPTSGLRSCDLG